MKCLNTLVTLLLLASALPAVAQDASGLKPPVEFVVTPGEAAATPVKQGVAWANGGVIDVAQPNPTTLIITMSGITATNADLVHTSVADYHFQLNQGFTVAANSPLVQSAKLTLEGRVIGLLRSNHDIHTHALGHKHCPTAETEPACADITNSGGSILTLSLPSRSTSCGDDLSVYNHEGPLTAMVPAGEYTLHESWGFGTTHPAFCCRGASAEFAPQPGQPPLPGGYWFEHFQPFNGLATRDFGYQVILKIVPEYKKPAPEHK